MLKKILPAMHYIHKKKIPKDVITPVQLAKISSATQKSFDEIMDLIAFLKTAGSGYGPFPYSSKLHSGKYE